MNNKAVSNIVGSFLLVGMAVMIFGTLYFNLIPLDFPTSNYILAELVYTDECLYHLGGNDITINGITYSIGDEIPYELGVALFSDDGKFVFYYDRENLEGENGGEDGMLHVDDDFDESTLGWGITRFDNIQDAVDAVNESGTVYVHNGTYNRNACINKTINLIGEDKNSVILDITNYSNTDFSDCIEVASNNVSISHFTIANGFSAAIAFRAELHDNCIISDCIIYDSSIGIQLSYGGTGITISNCIISHSRHAAIDIEMFSNVLIENCSISDTYGHELGIGLMIRRYCDNISVNDCSIFESYYHGILVRRQGSGSIPENISIVNCSIFNNTQDGIQLNECTQSTVKNCDIINNARGIRSCTSSIDNFIYHNNFISNTQNAYDSGNNTWDNGYPSGGNYWDDYTGIDGDGDGIGDTPYPIPAGDNQDLYPLMEEVL